MSSGTDTTVDPFGPLLGFATYEDAWTRVGGLQRQILELARAFGDRARLPPDLVGVDLVHVFGLHAGVTGFVGGREPIVWSPILSRPLGRRRLLAGHVRSSIRAEQSQLALARTMFGGVDGIVCLSHREHRWVQDFDGSIPTVVVGNAGDHILRADALEPEGLRRREPYVLCLGSLIERKQQLTLIQAAREWAPGLDLVIAGHVLDDDYDRRCRASLDPARMTMLPGQAASETRWLIENAAALVVASSGEGVPIVAHEAHALGTPVLHRASLVQMDELGWSVGIEDLRTVPDALAEARSVVGTDRDGESWAARAAKLDAFYRSIER